MFKKYAKNLLEKEITDKDFAEPSHLRTRPLENELQGYSFEESQAKSYQEESEWEEPETTLGEKVSVKGTLSFEKLLRIDGSFEGDLISEGKLIVGPTGKVKANINLKEAFISGKIEGDINVKERLVLRGHAEILGNITCPKISVDEGVTIMGMVSVLSTKTPETT